ncbi:MAG TPA: TetR/AcrR family transcriptional regulator [Candidatus Binatia bacterium]|nr:TetR/AcrR family transcriptional regulator [Candidatus Binatia bacterium]
MKKASATAVPGNRFERRRERTRQDLLAAAVEVLAAKGLHDTKIADIAAAADVGVGTFYLHFPTKEALFDAVVDETVTRLKRAVDAARLAATDPIARTLAATDAFCRFAGENRAVFKIVFGHPAAYNEVIHRAQSLFAADVEETVREGLAQGVFAPVPPPLAAQAVVGMATQILSWWTEHESVPIETIRETLSTLALRGLARAPIHLRGDA